MKRRGLPQNGINLSTDSISPSHILMTPGSLYCAGKILNYASQDYYKLHFDVLMNNNTAYHEMTR